VNNHSLAASPVPAVDDAGPPPRVAAADLLRDLDLTSDELRSLLDLAALVKRSPRDYAHSLNGKSIALLFEKPSLRTRLTFELAIKQLGGDSLFTEGPVGVREPLKDVARNLDRWVNGIVARVFSQATIEDLAHWSGVPVINALSDLFHPCQALADMQTIRERFGGLGGLKLAFVGDGNNVARSLAEGCGRMGMRFVMATPPGYRFDDEFLATLESQVPDLDLRVTADPVDAVRDAVAVYTDVWTSMGQEAETAKRRKEFASFQVNGKLMSQAPKGCYFMHCLPAHRGEEVTDEVIDGPNSIVVQQASNRLHVQKGVLAWVLGAQRQP